MTRQSAGARLRQLLTRDGTTIAAEAFLPLMARTAADAGFEALYCGGYSQSALHLGIPDFGLITSTELLELARPVIDAIDVPVVCDADQGGETALNVARTTRSFELAGAGAIHIEDSLNPKHMGSGAAPILPVAKMVDRIKAAVDARPLGEMLIIARTDAFFARAELAEIIDRAHAYAEAGADVFKVAMNFEGDLDLAPIIAACPLPVATMNHSHGEAARVGLKLNLSAGMMIRRLIVAARDSYAELKRNGALSLVELDEIGIGSGVDGKLLDRLLRLSGPRWP